jgi:hypothetical protein
VAPCESCGAAVRDHALLQRLLLYLLAPHRRGDVNMASVWERSRNDIIEGFAVPLERP